MPFLRIETRDGLSQLRLETHVLCVLGVSAVKFLTVLAKTWPVRD
jgi:hypothetical protein